MVLSVGITMTGCKKYLDVNSDPNRATDQTVTAELLFTQAQNAVGFRQASGDFTFLDNWIGYFAQNGGFAPQQNIIAYNVDITFGNTLFLNHYDVLYDLYLAKQKGLATGDTVLAGASMVLSAKLMQELVDLFGNLPYSQAWQSVKYPQPQYDKAQDIYKALQSSLDSAIIYLRTAPPKKYAKSDIITFGDTTGNKWVKFANTMKLRLLIRQSEVAGFDPSADMKKITDNGGVLMAGQSIMVNPGYSNDVNKQSPFYEFNGWDPTGVQTNTSTNANSYIITQFEQYTMPDPREGRFFYPVGFGFSGSSFVGCNFGDAQANIPQSTQSSYFGPALVGGVTAGSSHVGDGSGAKQSAWIYPSYESMFLWAEAVARGWVTGDAAAAFDAAVQESFVWLGVPDAASAYSDYKTNDPEVADFSNAGSTPLSKARFIAYQKYLSLVGIDPLEAYFDQNRLHFLTDNSYISLYAGRISNTIPVRLPYPSSEYTSNAANVNAQGAINVFTSKLFWQP